MATDKRDTTDSGVTGSLTDGSGIGTFTAPKIVKDFVVDVLLGAGSGLAAAGIVNIPSDRIGLTVAAFAIGKAIIAGLYRAILKWGQS